MYAIDGFCVSINGCKCHLKYIMHLCIMSIYYVHTSICMQYALLSFTMCTYICVCVCVCVYVCVPVLYQHWYHLLELCIACTIYAYMVLYTIHFVMVIMHVYQDIGIYTGTQALNR